MPAAAPCRCRSRPRPSRRSRPTYDETMSASPTACLLLPGTDVPLPRMTASVRAFQRHAAPAQRMATRVSTRNLLRHHLHIACDPAILRSCDPAILADGAADPGPRADPGPTSRPALSFRAATEILAVRRATRCGHHSGRPLIDTVRKKKVPSRGPRRVVGDAESRAGYSAA